MSDITNLCNRLKISWIRDNYEEELAEASRKKRTHQQFLERLLTGEVETRSAVRSNAVFAVLTCRVCTDWRRLTGPGHRS
jgi:hypothetical protein